MLNRIKQPLVSPMAVFLVPMLMLLLGLSGCASTESSGIAWQQDKKAVLQALQQGSEQQQQQQESLALLDKRIAALEKTVVKQTSTLAAMQATIKAQKKVRKKHAARPVAKRSVPVSKEERIEKETLTTKIDQIHSDIQQAVVASKKTYKPAEKNDYTAAYLALKSGRYDEAITSFQTFLNVYPDGEYADQAYYWLGESLLAKADFSKAISSFSSLTKNYPKSSKYQAGLLKLAMSYQQAGRVGDAKAVLQRLIGEAPDSKAAERARLRLSALNKK